ncbi:MAG: hypothetical protein ACKN95_03065, partial [Holophagaceae bacterium]
RNEQKSDQDFRTQGRRFQADLQSSLTELTEATKALNARLAVPAKNNSLVTSDDKSSGDSIVTQGDQTQSSIQNIPNTNPSNVSKTDESSFNAE